MTPANPATRTDPLAGLRYGVEIQGVISGWFTECNGLSLKRGTLPHKEGGVNDRVHYLPGRVEQSNITLKRGMISGENASKLWDWFNAGLYDCKVERHNISIILYSSDLTEVRRWNLTDAYPVKWSGPDFKSDSNQVAIETLEIVYHGIEATGS